MKTDTQNYVVSR